MERRTVPLDSNDVNIDALWRISCNLSLQREYSGSVAACPGADPVGAEKSQQNEEAVDGTKTELEK